MRVWLVDTAPIEELSGLKRTTVNIDDLLVLFQGQRRGENWGVPEARVASKREDLPVNFPDFPFFDPGAFGCSDRARRIIEPYINDEVEWLPLNVENHKGKELVYWVLNVINVLDCIDKSQATFELSAMGGVKEVSRYSFSAQALGNVHLFKTPELPATRIYATDSFRDLITAHDLTGLRFRQVFPGDERPYYGNG